MPTTRQRRTTTSYAVLGLLSVRTWTTYELAKQVQRSLKWFWPRAERKLYDEPKSLVADGLAAARKEYTGQRASTVYEITDAGHEALRAWLSEPSAPRATEFEAMLKLFFADAGSLEQAAAIVDDIEASTTERLRELADLAEHGARGDVPFPERRHISAITLRLQVGQEAAVLDWARWARDQLAAWRSTTDPDGWDSAASMAELAAQARRLLSR